MAEQNPFLVPGGDAGQGGSFDPGGRSVAAGRGIEWLKQGWQLFTKNPGMWIAIAVILMVVFIVLSFIPVIGGLAAQFLMPVFAGGILLGCRSLSEGGEFGIDTLFAGFKQNTTNLVLVGVFYLVGVIAITVLVFLIGGGAALTGGLIGRGPGVGMAIGGFFVALLVMLALMVPLAMAVWFAPALVVFRDIAPLEAMKASFFACLKNIVPFLVYGVIVFVLCVVAMIPFGLGMLVMVPVLMGALYSSYVEIFE
ncbi:MAG: BPSS1780 family membrane protein [Candidatus Desulfobacillus denitrificans]|nr:BPSS1780 family membrane protein [Candidatus Desulfobacillus denitrificans]HNT62172.1 BPSS1780 family membrane protein [Candidatus Desulfobacillus denitrificans]